MRDEAKERVTGILMWSLNVGGEGVSLYREMSKSWRKGGSAMDGRMLAVRSVNFLEGSGKKTKDSKRLPPTAGATGFPLLMYSAAKTSSSARTGTAESRRAPDLCRSRSSSRHRHSYCSLLKTKEGKALGRLSMCRSKTASSPSSSHASAGQAYSEATGGQEGSQYLLCSHHSRCETNTVQRGWNNKTSLGITPLSLRGRDFNTD
ncbi:hypothetical protein AOLI_G00184640 [Acnodon oligacanthus]